VESRWIDDHHPIFTRSLLRKGRTPMTSTWLLRAGILAGGLAAACLPALAVPASADPLSEALATTTCNYAQVTAAMNAQTPELAAQLSLRPDMQANLQSFLALPIDQRRQRISQEQAANPALQQMLAAAFGPQVSQLAGSCMNY
jgi:hemophore-related protein